jgi:thymidylate synthase
MIEGEPKPAPKFEMDRSVTDFYAFTKDSFKVTDYDFTPFNETIPVAI